VALSRPKPGFEFPWGHKGNAIEGWRFLILEQQRAGTTKAGRKRSFTKVHEGRAGTTTLKQGASGVSPRSTKEELEPRCFTKLHEGRTGTTMFHQVTRRKNWNHEVSPRFTKEELEPRSFTKIHEGRA
jgi:hypothetical protein